MENKKIIILYFVIAITISFIAVSLFQWKYNNDYAVIHSGLEQEFQELRNLVNEGNNTEEILTRIDSIENYVSFQENICFEDGKGK